MYALLKSKNRSKQAVASMLISAITTGLGSATLSFDFDVDPAKRKEDPEFYGYVPEGAARTWIFGCMVLNGTLLLLAKSFCAAMLMLVEKKYFVWYSVGDMILYFLQKIMRNDFHYWFPIDGVFGIFMSVLLRVITKTITDYTGIVQFRGPAELGGIYWSFDMVVSVVIVPIAAIKIYYVNTKPEDFVVEEKTARFISGSLGGAWLIIFGLFMMLVKKEFRGTFYNLQTGFEWARNFFLAGKSDDVKAAILACNRKQWTAIEEDVKAWVLDNWERWEEEEPDWFTEVWKASVDDEWLPKEELRKQEVAGGGQRRRSSLGELMGGSVRERRGSATIAPEVDAGVGAPHVGVVRRGAESPEKDEEMKVKVVKKKGKRYEDDSDEDEQL
jgi:hypothetical protein